MFISCWSAKGGSGTTVIAATLALLMARDASEDVVLVDLAGDLPAVLGLAEPTGPGVAEWLAAGPDVAADGWARLARPAAPGLALVARGAVPLDGRAGGANALGGLSARAEVLAGMLAMAHHPVVIDCGVVGGPEPGPAQEVARTLAAAGTQSLLITRACYLALRRASGAGLHPSGIVLVREPGRALLADDVAAVVGAPIVAEVGVEPEIARAVDAGLLARRLPRGLDRALRHAA